MKEINIENWNRKNQFEFFKNYEDPFFNVTATLDVTNLYNHCKKNNLSFFLAGLYTANQAMNSIPAFRLRLKEGKIVQFDKVHIDSTVLNEDNTFSFCHFETAPTFLEFMQNGEKVLFDHKNGIVENSHVYDLDVAHSTTIPWISITSIKHARNGNEKNIGIPKIVFGKYYQENDQKIMPFSVEVHHALMDGIHVGLLFQKMQEFINELE
ncbi:chloramphenicol O-acetyltransferase type A [Lutibacter oricola]|uniref:Chloramphenicol O-acetyltransferase type A n=1 Tax=Lutibacter oricola TaxID=762486 RepID=A0A1H2ZGH1_9FLAO|nr:CatA-like O-acetyltransferase [Lutibacter oricola]SDX16407.1 chloramphenicol O-acetyltransferase type A [Lutibacter oricola]